MRDFRDGDRAEEMKSAGPSLPISSTLDDEIGGGDAGAAIEEVKGVQASAT